MQLNSFYVDASALASDVYLYDRLLPQLTQRKSGRVTFIFKNEGTATVTVETATDIANAVRSAKEIGPGKTFQDGPHEWPDRMPYLHSPLGAKTKVTPHWEE